MAFPRRSTSNNAIGSPITDGTATRILYEGSGPVLADDANLTWDATNKQINVVGLPLANIYVAIAVVTHAQILLLDTAYISVIPAAGAGKGQLPLLSYLSADFSAGAYTNMDALANLALVNDASGNYDQVTLQTSTAFDFTAKVTGQILIPEFAVDSITHQVTPFYAVGTHTNWSNKPTVIALSNGSNGHPTGGNAANTITVTTLYFVVDL